jgi:ribosome recycling factor
MVKDTLAQTETKMKKSVESLHHHLASVRTGRHRPRSLIRCRSSTTAQICQSVSWLTCSVSEARMLTIQPWDQSAVKAIEKAIQNRQFGH